MPDRWENIVKDADERKVFEALSDGSFDFRTIQGIAKSTGLEQGKVEEILKKHADLVRVSPVPSRQGRQLYTLRSNPVRTQEMAAFARTLISKSVSQ